jgi:hypothetical protein
LKQVFSEFCSQVIILIQLFTVHFSVPVIDSEKEIEDHSKKRNEYGEKEISQCLCGAAGIVNNAQTY